MLNRLKKIFHGYFRSCVDFALLERIQKLEDRVLILEFDLFVHVEKTKDCIRLLQNDDTSIDAKADLCLRSIKHLEEELKK